MRGGGTSSGILSVASGCSRRHSRSSSVVFMQQRRKARFALDQRPDADILAIEMQKVEDEEHQPGRVAGIRCGLDHTERGDAVGKDAA